MTCRPISVILEFHYNSSPVQMKKKISQNYKLYHAIVRYIFRRNKPY